MRQEFTGMETLLTQQIKDFSAVNVPILRIGGQHIFANGTLPDQSFLQLVRCQSSELVIVRQIEPTVGSITYSSQPSKATTFRLTLPLADPADLTGGGP